MALKPWNCGTNSRIEREHQVSFTFLLASCPFVLRDFETICSANWLLPSSDVKLPVQPSYVGFLWSCAEYVGSEIVLKTDSVKSWTEVRCHSPTSGKDILRLPWRGGQYEFQSAIIPHCSEDTNFIEKLIDLSILSNLLVVLKLLKTGQNIGLQTWTMSRWHAWLEEHKSY